MRVLLLTLILAGVSCGREDKNNESCVLQGKHCHEEKNNRTTQGQVGPAGPRGATGPTGLPGVQGETGAGCEITQIINGALIICGDYQVAIFNGTNGIDGIKGEDGQDGVDGQDGQDAAPTAYSITEAYDPCGDGPGFDEVLLRTAGNKIIAHYAGGGNLQFLTFLTPGSYVTTDQNPCYFSIDANMVIYNEHL